MHIEKSAGVLGGLKGMSDRLPQTFTVSPLRVFSVALGAQDYQWARWITPHPSWWPPFFSLSMVTFLRDQEAHQWEVVMAGVVDWFVEGWLVAYVLSDVVLPEVYAFRFYVWIWWCVQSFRDCSNVAYCQWSFWTCTSPAFAPLHRGCFISHFFSTAFKSFRLIFFFRFLQSGSSPRVVIGPFANRPILEVWSAEMRWNFTIVNEEIVIDLLYLRSLRISLRKP